MQTKNFVRKTGRYYTAYFLTDETNLITKAWLGNEALKKVGLQKSLQVLLLNTNSKEILKGVTADGFEGNSLYFDAIDQYSYTLWRIPEYDLTYDFDNFNYQMSYFLLLYLDISMLLQNGLWIEWDWLTALLWNHS